MFYKAAEVVPLDLVSVGYISGAYGVNGWVRIRPYSADAGALLYAKNWWLNKPVDLHGIEMLQAKIHGEDVVAQLVGIVDRNAAELLKGALIQIRRDHFPPLSDNEFYWVDLIGLTVGNLQDESLGVVKDLMDNGAHPILRVSAHGLGGQKKLPREFLIPFVDQFVKKVDRIAKKITVDWELDY